MMAQEFIEKTLRYILIALVLVIATVTAVVFVTSRDSIGKEYRKADPTPQQVIKKSTKHQTGAYNEIGEIRAITKAPEDSSKGTVLMITPWFSYQADNHPLYEELCQKNRQFKSLISEYFLSYTYDELKAKGEDGIKQDLTDLVNNQLILGHITAVYFEKFVFFE